MNRLRTVSAATAAVALLLGLSACGTDPGGGQPDGGVPDVDATPDGPPETYDRAVDGQLVINELMATNATTVIDGGVARDWIELYNPTDTTLRLQGYGITDDLGQPGKHLFGPSVSIPARGRLLLWADNEVTLGASHLKFQLRREGGEIGLSRPDGTWIDRVTYGEQAVDFSAAREPDGSDGWVIEWLASPGAANPAGDGARVGLENPAVPPEAVPAAGDLSEQLLGYDLMPEFALTIGAAEMAALRAQPKEYVRAQINFRGRTWGPVGVRLKGVNSFQPIDAKPSFKLDFDEYVPGGRFFGLEKLTFNNMDDDFSMMHERLAYWIARHAEVPSSRSNHARLTVNGQAYGLYANVETVDRRMLARWFGPDPQGPLYEATDVDFMAQYIPLFDHKSGPDERSMLTGLADALTIADPDQALTAAAQYVDLDGWLRFWAFESVVAQLDAYPFSIPGDDIYVYLDPQRKLQFIPWGMDETFYSAELDVTSPTFLHGVLATKCKASAVCFQRYANAVWDVQAVTEAIGLVDERARVAAQIAPWVAADRKKPYTDADVSTFQMNLYWFVTERRMRLSGMVPPRSN